MTFWVTLIAYFALFGLSEALRKRPDSRMSSTAECTSARQPNAFECPYCGGSSLDSRMRCRNCGAARQPKDFVGQTAEWVSPTDKVAPWVDPLA